jgi:hypothetical protein
VAKQDETVRLYVHKLWRLRVTKLRYLKDYFSHSSENTFAKQSIERAFEAVGEHVERLEKRIDALEKLRPPGGDRGR